MTSPRARADSAHSQSPLDDLDLVYRALCSMLYNYAPTSGHPGGSVSAGRILASLLFRSMDYDLGAPDRPDADLICFAAGHKALGLYAMWALRDEMARIGAPELLPATLDNRLRLEDLLGFRRNPVTATPLFREFGSTALDGHPTPAVPFVPIASGASGVGFTAAVGLALAARDLYADTAPIVHVIEGEGGLTPGRVAEGLAAAATAGLSNLILHTDWNQSSIDSDRVCATDRKAGDYVQWSPAELFHAHGWQVIDEIPGHDPAAIAEAQRTALETRCKRQRPTALVYRTVKGWRYGIEGRASHGAGHRLCSADFYTSVRELHEDFGVEVPRCLDRECCEGDQAEQLETCFWKALASLRKALESKTEMVSELAEALRASRRRLDEARRRPRRLAPDPDRLHQLAGDTPNRLKLEPGASTTLRQQLGRCLDELNVISSGALMISAADLLGSTSAAEAGHSFPEGLWHAQDNPEARLVAIGGICEDAISGVMSGLASFGHHIGVGASYAAFLAPLSHISCRLHAIGAQARRLAQRPQAQPLILIMAHAGLKTGEDGPTHADPQALQLMQENFPGGSLITLTPWEPQEIWPLLHEALLQQPAVITPFVTRPAERIINREERGLAPAGAARTGVYVLREAAHDHAVTVILQGSGVTYEFVENALPRLLVEGIDPRVISVVSPELFDLQPSETRQAILGYEERRKAIGITGFTKPTLYRWVTSEEGRQASLHPFRARHYLGSGSASQVLAEAGLDGESQYRAIRDFALAKTPRV